MVSVFQSICASQSNAGFSPMKTLEDENSCVDIWLMSFVPRQLINPCSPVPSQIVWHWDAAILEHLWALEGGTILRPPTKGSKFTHIMTFYLSWLTTVTENLSFTVRGHEPLRLAMRITMNLVSSRSCTSEARADARYKLREMNVVKQPLKLIEK